MIEVDGSYGEGGGQIIRTAVSLSALTEKPVHIFNIRANRQPPGLKAQHLTGVNAVASICNAKVTGTEMGSTELTFQPGEIKGGTYEWDIGTAGSIPLVLQALMPALLFSKKEFSISIIGGTNVKTSPPIDYFQHIFCDYIAKMGAKIKFEIKRYGFYPKGGGVVKLRVEPTGLTPIEIIERGELKQTDIQDSIASKDLEKAHVAERQVNGFKKEFGESKYKKTFTKYVDTFSTGSSIHAHNSYENCKIGSEALGERGKPAEEVGSECAKKLKKEISYDSTLDTHMLDQIIPYMAMLGGKFKFGEITSHAKTNIWVTEKFIPVKFNLENNMITVEKLENEDAGSIGNRRRF
jgi:RNA 3'-phosphate cyclase